MKLVEHFYKALAWVHTHSPANSGIFASSSEALPYPEVTGYFIPTLCAWNEMELAESYGRWLISTQLSSGAWADPSGKFTCIFDTGQIVKGLLALHERDPKHEYCVAIKNACDWVVSHIRRGELQDIPDKAVWGSSVPEGVLLYAFEAIRRAGILHNNPEWVEKSDIAIKHFLNQKDLMTFDRYISHFHAYIIEALCDLQQCERAEEAMDTIAKLQRKNGAVPAFPHTRWVCSTGLFQYAICWYKLGQTSHADAAFNYAVSLQNPSGGWFGSYGWFRKYFPASEIAWAVKFFLDAFQLKLMSAFEGMSGIFSDYIDPEDGRYKLLEETLCQTAYGRSRQPLEGVKILDAGCGKGRYLRHLAEKTNFTLYGVDCSAKVMGAIPENIITAHGSLLDIPFANATFDFVYTIEALEHAVHIDGALRELLRVLKPGGTLLIIDKNAAQAGKLTLPDWEQWFDAQGLAKKLEVLGCSVEVRCNIPYESAQDGLFIGWVAHKLK